MGIDILEMSKKDKIIIMIDYFSRKIMAKNLETQEADKVLKFIQDCYIKMPFKKLISDNGKEFNNSKLKIWLNENGIEHKFAIPYYHQSNGRIERVNRTIRNALSKTGGMMKIKLPQVVNNYNNMYHRAIGMSPEMAYKKENNAKVKEHTKIYKKEFEVTNAKLSQFNVGDKVYIRNEQRSTKDQDRYNESGQLIEKLYGDVYSVKTKDDKVIIRHRTKLRELVRGKLDQ